ncbi:MAG: HNH endonuclease, partial [Deltaproteobacteria bacterium]|nr:HNH endonuclease [Deltaproteobacteria bacterium]
FAPEQRDSRAPARGPEEESESGLRAEVWPRLRWKARPSRKRDRLARLACGLEDCSPRELDRRLRVAIAFLQQVDFEIGRILRQVVDRKLYRELGFESFERYVQERLDLSPRTARRLVRLARAEHGAPALANAFREGRITLLQAEVLLRGEKPGALETALRVTLRRLEDEVLPRRVAFWAPPEVAALFEALVARLGFETMLDHAIATWLEAGAQFEDYADFTRDGFRCTVPACTARRNLQSHHIHFRSACGPDVAWNRTTLCGYHHHRGVHAGSLALRGRAPDGLIYELGVGRFRSGDVVEVR